MPTQKHRASALNPAKAKKIFKKSLNHNSKLHSNSSASHSSHKKRQNNSTNFSTSFSNQQKFVQIAILCVLVFLIMLSVVSRLSRYQSGIVSEEILSSSNAALIADTYFKKLDLTNPDVLSKLQTELDAGSPDQIDEIIKKVSLQFGENEDVSLDSTETNTSISASQDSEITSQNQENQADIQTNAPEKSTQTSSSSSSSGLFSSVLSMFSSNSPTAPNRQTYRNTLVLSGDEEDKYAHHDSRLPEKPVAAYKGSNDYRNPGNLQFYDPPMPQYFANYDQNDLRVGG